MTINLRDFCKTNLLIPTFHTFIFCQFDVHAHRSFAARAIGTAEGGHSHSGGAATNPAATTNSWQSAVRAGWTGSKVGSAVELLTMLMRLFIILFAATVSAQLRSILQSHLAEDRQDHRAAGRQD